MAGTIYSKFFWQDWQGDDLLAMCSMAAQGFWMRCLVLAARSTVPGHVLLDGKKPTATELLEATRCRRDITVEDVEGWVAELKERGVCSVTREGVMFSRRLVRDTRRRQISSTGGKARQKQIAETIGEIPVGTKQVAQPLSTINQNPSAISHQPEAKAAAGTLRKMIEATGVDPTHSPHETIRWQRHADSLIEAGLDIDLDVIPVMQECKTKGRVPADLGGPLYFRKMATERRDGRLAQGALASEKAQARQALSREDWIRGFEKFLDRGYWLGEFGAFPTEAKPDAPADILERAQAAWDTQGQKPKNLDRVLWPHRAPVPFFGSNIVQLQARQA